MPIINVPSHREAGKTYEVNTDEKTCNCIGFRIRKSCSHLVEAMNQEQQENKAKINSNVSFDLSKLSFPMPVEDFEAKYGFDMLNILKINQDVYEKRGMVYKY